MCVTNIYTDVYPDGRRAEFRQTSICQYGLPGRPCSRTSILENPPRKISWGEPTTEYMLTSHQKTSASFSISNSTSSSNLHRSEASTSSPSSARSSRSSSSDGTVKRQHRKERIIIVDSPPTPRIARKPSTTASHGQGRPILIEERPRVPPETRWASSRPDYGPPIQDVEVTAPRYVGDRGVAQSQGMLNPPQVTEDIFNLQHDKDYMRILQDRVRYERAKQIESSADRQQERRLTDLERPQHEEQIAKRRYEERIAEEERIRRDHFRYAEELRAQRQRAEEIAFLNQTARSQPPLPPPLLSGQYQPPLRSADEQTDHRHQRDERIAQLEAEIKEEEIMRQRLRERQMPSRRFSVGPAERRKRVLYSEGVYRWEESTKISEIEAARNAEAAAADAAMKAAQEKAFWERRLAEDEKAAVDARKKAEENQIAWQKRLEADWAAARAKDVDAVRKAGKAVAKVTKKRSKDDLTEDFTLNRHVESIATVSSADRHKIYDHEVNVQTASRSPQREASRHAAKSSLGPKSTPQAISDSNRSRKQGSSHISDRNNLPFRETPSNEPLARPHPRESRVNPLDTPSSNSMPDSRRPLSQGPEVVPMSKIIRGFGIDTQRPQRDYDRYDLHFEGASNVSISMDHSGGLKVPSSLQALDHQPGDEGKSRMDALLHTAPSVPLPHADVVRSDETTKVPSSGDNAMNSTTAQGPKRAPEQLLSDLQGAAKVPEYKETQRAEVLERPNDEATLVDTEPKSAAKVGLWRRLLGVFTDESLFLPEPLSTSEIRVEVDDKVPAKSSEPSQSTGNAATTDSLVVTLSDHRPVQQVPPTQVVEDKANQSQDPVIPEAITLIEENENNQYEYLVIPAVEIDSTTSLVSTTNYDLTDAKSKHDTKDLSDHEAALLGRVNMDEQTAPKVMTWAVDNSIYPDIGSALNIISEDSATSWECLRNPHQKLYDAVAKNVSAASISAYATASLEKVKRNGRRALCVVMGGKEHLGCPDTGSDKNIMSEDLARSEKFRIRSGPNDKKLFELGNGTHVMSVGRVRISCALTRGYMRKKKTWFHVLANCAYPLIIGRQSLDEAELLTKNRHLLERCPPEMLRLSSLFFIGTPRKSAKVGMGININGHFLKAVADTGADLNLMSLACADREGFKIDRSTEARQRLQVADGSVVETVGRVYIASLSLDWRQVPTISVDSDVEVINAPEGTEQVFGDATELTGEIFHVVDGLPCDLILGEPFLDKTDAFNTIIETKEDDLLDTVDQPYKLKIFRHLGPLQVFMSKMSRGKIPKQDGGTKYKDARQKHVLDLRAENYRRLKEERRIETLDDLEQQTAMATHQAAVQAYELRHAGCIYCKKSKDGWSTDSTCG